MSDNRHGTGRATTARADMAAHDALPPALRRALGEADDNLSAEEVLAAVTEDLSERQVLELLARRGERSREAP